MIKVKFKYDTEKGSLKMKVQGHACCAPKGEDLVCAAVSALAITAGQVARMFWCEGWLKQFPLVQLCEGNALVILTPKEECLESSAMAFWTVQAGIFALQQRYPQHVHLEEVMEL